MEPLGRVALLATAALLAAGCGSSAAKPTASAVKLPAIHEVFTLVPCPHTAAARGTTVGIEGCLEHTILRTDARIRTEERTAFRALNPAGRRALVRAERAWLLYRKETCDAEASNSGGTILPAIFGECIVGANRGHLAELGAVLQSLRKG